AEDDRRADDGGGQVGAQPGHAGGGGGEQRLDPTGVLLGAGPDGRLDPEAGADQGQDEGGGAEEAVDEVAAATSDEVGDGLVVAHEVLDVAADRAVGQAAEEQPGGPPDQ